MGVRGLESFLEQHCHQACYTVDIIEIVKRYKKENNFPPLIVVEANAVMRHFYKNEVKAWLHGGQLKQYAEALKKLIYSFQTIEAELIFIFEGTCISEFKYKVWKDKYQNPRREETVFAKINNGADLETEEKNGYLVPNNLKIITMYLAKSMGCKVLTSAVSNLCNIAVYAQQSAALAILAQDSDFIIIEGVEFYLSVKNLDMNKMITLNYDRKKLAEFLKISTSHLPVLASLLGNSFINRDNLQEFHRRFLLKTFYRRSQFGILISDLASFIRDYLLKHGISNETYKTMSSYVFPYDEDMRNLLYDSILFYDRETVDKENKANLELIRTNSDQNWSAILKKVMELLVSTVISKDVAYVILNQTWKNKAHIEDYLKILERPVSEIMEPLHEKFYGILLYEKSEECQVEEHYTSGPQSLDHSYFVKPVKPDGNHPGLLALWDGGVVEDKWHLIGYVFGVPVDRIRSLPPHLVVPGLTFRYLNSSLEIENWEMDALISSACLLRDYSVESLKALERPHVGIRSIILYSLITATYYTVINIFNGVGDPLSIEEIIPLNYQDGHLFNFKYWQASRRYNVPELCDEKEMVINKFMELKSFIISKF